MPTPTPDASGPVPKRGHTKGCAACRFDTSAGPPIGDDYVPTIGPARLRCWVLRHIGHRGAFLLFLALLDIVYAFGLAFPTPQALKTPTSMYLQEAGSLWLWAGLWLTAGIFCGVFAFRRRDAFGFVAAMLIKVLWSVMFLLGWIFAGVERGYLSAAIWGAFACVVWLVSDWPEPKRGRE